MYPVCPLAGLAAANFSAVSTACRSPALAQACLECLPAIVGVFTSAGITDALPLEACLVQYTPLYLQAGADPFALSAFAGCSAAFGFQVAPPASSCQLDLPVASFSSTAGACADPKYTCSVCTADLLNVFVRAGLPVTDYSASFGLAQYYVIQACIYAHLTRILAAGASATTLALVPSCPRPAGFSVGATLVVGGVARAALNVSSFAGAVAAAVGVRAAEVIVQNVTDAAALPGRRRLLAAGLRVHFVVSVATEEEQARVALALQSRAASAAVLAQLQAAGLPATSVALVSLDDAAGAGAPGAERVSNGTIVGAVVGSVLGAGALAAVAVALLAHRRRHGAADAASRKQQQEQQQDGAPSQLRPLSQGLLYPEGLMDSNSSSSEGSTAGWRAVTCDASEVALSERIGAGAFATVYRAAWRGSQVAVKVWQPGHEVAALQQVAIRVDGSHVSLRPGLPGACMVGTAAEVDVSFMREVALLSSLRHPNILAIYALVKAPPMLVMELGLAGSLKDLLARTCLQTLPWQRRLAIAVGVACGVEHLHAQSPPIIHTDLKTANVVLDTSLVPKARALRAHTLRVPCAGRCAGR
jgi:hypothetical protein